MILLLWCPGGSFASQTIILHFVEAHFKVGDRDIVIVSNLGENPSGGLAVECVMLTSILALGGRGPDGTLSKGLVGAAVDDEITIAHV